MNRRMTDRPRLTVAGAGILACCLLVIASYALSGPSTSATPECRQLSAELLAIEVCKGLDKCPLPVDVILRQITLREQFAARRCSIDDYKIPPNPFARVD